VNHQVSLLHFKPLILCALLFSSCARGADSNIQLEITAVRYESTEAPHCVGEVKNISSVPLNNLKVEVEFQTANGERVRGKTVDLTQKDLQPNTDSNFSAPYLKGSNDPQVVGCRVLRLKTDGDGTILHINRSVK
jgi:hypothetical protein